MTFERELRRLLGEAVADQEKTIVAGNFATIESYRDATGRYWGLKKAIDLCDEADKNLNKG